MDIQLPPFVLADLYKNTLVLATDAVKVATQPPTQVTQKAAETKAEIVPPAQKQWYLGDNKRGIVIVVRDENAVFINDEWLETLSKLLAALKINLADIAIVNTVQTAVDFTRLKEINARHIILFGVTTEQIQMPFAIPYYQVQNYAGCTILAAPVVTLAPPAQTTDGIKAEKRKLWESLKRISF